jgi:hypothetical protein
MKIKLNDDMHLEIKIVRRKNRNTSVMCYGCSAEWDGATRFFRCETSGKFICEKCFGKPTWYNICGYRGSSGECEHTPVDKIVIVEEE